jgi:putative flippase GtrA
MPKDKIIAFIDFFYPPFKKFMPEQTFRYAACGGSNTLLGLAVFSFFHEIVFRGRIFYFDFFALKPHTASNTISFIITLVAGFLMMKYIVFTDSNLRGRIQFFRYFLSAVFNFVISTLLLKLFVEVLNLHAVFSQVVITCIIIVISYLSQKHFSFKVKQENTGVKS